MNGKRLIVMTLAIIMVAYGGQLLSQENVATMRGVKSIEDTSSAPESKRWEPDSSPLTRDFVQQPPLIPHSTKGYQINLKFNKCLTCHSWANHKEAGATKISLTHFKDRDGNELSNVSASRYFCTQCHVPQRDTAPLVENEFEPVKVLR
uniref:Periplasmic nitrate reductase, electron transfer subunit n=1 Tax=uncultured bacterium pES01019D12 TaxID=355333 RepID=A0EJJ6_9BACT|nr:nitrate reductase [uncultured bacterium pES01019D12]